MRALIVDDSPTFRFILGNVLRRLRAEVVEAPNGREALQALTAAGRFDVVFTDWNMPEMNGQEFVQRLRINPLTRHTIVIAVTSTSDFDLICSGVNDVVFKPFTDEMIEEKLSWWSIS